VSQWVDLTLTLGGPKVTAVPGLPGVEIDPVMDHPTHFRHNTKITMSIHVCTHVDAPYHFHVDGDTVDEMPLEKYMGPGLLLDLRSRWQRRAPVTLDDIKALSIPDESFHDKIVVFYTGWVESEFGQPHVYTDNPHMGVDTARYLVEQGVRAVGVDFAVDANPPIPTPRPENYPVHRILLGADIPLIENLVNLDKLAGKKFELFALPIKIYRGDGAATRAVAWLLD